MKSFDEYLKSTLIIRLRFEMLKHSYENAQLELLLKYFESA